MDKMRLEVLLSAVDKITGPLKAIQAGSSAASAKFKELRDSIKGFEKNKALIENFRNTHKAIKGTTAQLGEAQANIKTMAAEHAAAGTVTAVMARQMDKAKAEAKALKDKLQANQQTLQILRDKMQAAGVSTTGLANQERDLRGKIGEATTAMEAQRQVLERQAMVEKRLAALREKHGATMMKLAKWGGAAVGAQFAGQKLGGWVGKPVQEFTDAEQARTQLQVAFMTANGGASAELKQITDLAQKLGDKMPGTTADFINMMTALKKEGMSAKTILGGLGEASANLAVLLEMAPVEAAQFGAKMQDALQASESEMMGILDMMQRSHYAGADAQYMLAGFGNMAPVLQIIKQKGMEAMKTLSPLMVMMNQAGMTDGSSAGNAIRKVYQYTMDAKKLKKANAAISAAGGKFKIDFSNGKGEFGGLEKMFSQLEKLRGFNTMQRGSIIKELFGDDAETLRVLNQFIEKGLPGYKETVQKLQEQADLQERVNKLLGTLKNVAESAQGSLSNLLVDLGETIAPELKGVLDWLGEMAVKMKDWVQANPRVAKTLMMVAAGGAALLAIAGTLGLALVGMASALAMVRMMSGRFLLNLLGARAAGGAAAEGTGLAVRASNWLIASWGRLKALGIGGLFASIGPQIGGMLTHFTTFRGVLGLAQGGLWQLLRFVFMFARANPVAAVVLGIAGALAGFYAHWDKIKEFWDKGQWWNLAKEIWSAIEWGLNAASMGLYGFFKTMAAKALGAVWEGMKSAVNWGGDEAQNPAAKRASVAAAALAAASTAAMPAAADIPKIQAARQELASASVAAGASISPAAKALNIGQVKLLGADAKPLAPMATLAPKASTAAAPVITTTNTFHITAAPGMDEKALARAVGTEMDRRTRQTAARRNSSLYDLD